MGNEHRKNSDDLANDIKEKDFEKYDKKISQMLFDDDFKEDMKDDKTTINNKKYKNSDLKNYAEQIKQEQLLEEMNRSKSMNKELKKNNYDLENANKGKVINKKRKDNNIKIKVIDNNKNDNNPESKLKTEENIKIKEKKEKKNYEKIEPKAKKRNFIMRLFTPSKKLKKFQEEENKRSEISQNISSQANHLNYKKQISTQIPKTKIYPGDSKTTIINKETKEVSKESKDNENINKGYISEGNIPREKHIPNKERKDVITKDIYDKIKQEDLKVVVTGMKESNNKFQEGLDLLEKKNYTEAKNCFNQARISFMNLNKLINNNVMAYPSKFRIVISLKINEKMRVTLDLIKECNSFLIQNKNERSSKSQGKTNKNLHFNLLHKNSNNTINNKTIDNNYFTHRNINSKNNLNLNNNNNTNNKNKNLSRYDMKFKNNIYNNVFKNNIQKKNLNYNKINNNNINNNKYHNLNKKEGDVLEEKLSSEIMMSNTGIKFDDIIGMSKVKKILKEEIILPNIRPDLFKGIKNPLKGILLFGPPDTGKKMIAKAVASEYKSTFFNISYSSPTSKLFGESEETVKILFNLASKKSPSIIFIDEIDLIFTKGNENETTKRIKTEFLTQFDGLNNNKVSKLLVIGSTNRPMDLDEALLERFTKRIYCGPLDEIGRFHFIKKTINKVSNSLNDKDIKQIAKLTNGYSNNDLIELCRDAALQPVRELNMEEILKIKNFRDLIKNDLLKSLKKIRGSLSNKIIEELLIWNESF